MNIISRKVAGLGAAIFASVLAIATANASVTHQELVALSGGANSVSATLPDVTISPPAPFASFYDTGHSPKVGSEHYIPASHYTVPPGYDAMVAMHPYTSGFGVCTEGASPAQGCHHPTGTPIPPSHYERMPFMQ
jgi:hypothetical protein